MGKHINLIDRIEAWVWMLAGICQYFISLATASLLTNCTESNAQKSSILSITRGIQ